MISIQPGQAQVGVPAAAVTIVGGQAEFFEEAQGFGDGIGAVAGDLGEPGGGDRNGGEAEGEQAGGGRAFESSHEQNVVSGRHIASITRKYVRYKRGVR